MNLNEFYYDLPQELIAQHPLADRSSSRLLHLNSQTGETVHRHFSDLLDFIQPNDCLVINNTRVIPARLYGQREDTGSPIEFVLLHRVGELWEVILRPGKRAKVGKRFTFGGGALKAEIVDIVNEGNRLVRFEYEGVFEEVLDRLGEVPLPPYITEKLDDAERYQTVYAKHSGSAAAPTAGLHFTTELLNAIEKKGATIAPVTLHVGLGTFRPVKVERIEDHKMHEEFYVLPQESADKINACKAKGGRVIAVGTTSVRTLETVADEEGKVAETSGWTGIFIYPGYRYKIVDAIVTNFHLPCSTLMMLISAFASKDFVFKAYKEAIDQRYRFFSFGDAMFIEGGQNVQNS